MLRLLDVVGPARRAGLRRAARSIRRAATSRPRTRTSCSRRRRRSSPGTRQEKVETFTVQPKFEGNAARLRHGHPHADASRSCDEMPRDFFKELAVFTILEADGPQQVQAAADPSAAGLRRRHGRWRGRGATTQAETGRRCWKRASSARWITRSSRPSKADDLYAWLKENKYSYCGDEATLDFYIKKKWFFTVMKIDPMQMKKNKDGSYDGEVTPTRFTFASEKLVYPLKITQISRQGQDRGALLRAGAAQGRSARRLLLRVHLDADVVARPPASPSPRS